MILGGERILTSIRQIEVIYLRLLRTIQRIIYFHCNWKMDTIRTVVVTYLSQIFPERIFLLIFRLKNNNEFAILMFNLM